MTTAQKLGVLAILALLLLWKPSGGVPSPLKEFPGSYVLVVDEFDARAKLPKTQLSILTSAELTKWLDQNTTAWRKLDQGDDVTNEQPWVKAAWKRERKALPWLGVWSDKGWWEGPLPENVTAFQGRVMKAKGEMR